MKNPYRSEAEREELILKYLPLVKAIAVNIKKHLPEDLDLRDLISYGIIGLIKAVDNLITEDQKKAEAYIKLRVKGAIYDYLRSLDFGSRQLRKREREIKEVVERLKGKLGREPTDEEIAKELGISTQELFRTLDKINFSYILSLEEVFRDFTRDYSELMPSSVNVEEEVIKRELAEKVKKAVSKLPDREKLVIQLIFYEELPAREVAKVLGTSVSRVSQLKAKALKHLREIISNLL